MLGALSKTPTTLHLVNMPHVGAGLLSITNGCRCVSDNFNPAPMRSSARALHVHQTVLRGKNPDGTFKSAPARQYPSRMNEVIAKGTIQGVSVNKNAGPIDWNAFILEPAYKFYMALDPYNPAHQWGQFGMDRAGAQAPAQHTTNVGSTCYPASALDMPTAPVTQLARAPFVPPVPRLSHEIAAICYRKRAEALARRQARLLSNAPVVDIEAPASQEPQRGYYTVDIPGLIAISATSTRRSKFRTGKNHCRSSQSCYSSRHHQRHTSYHWCLFSGTASWPRNRPTF
jgi:hypothetical protein